MIQIELKSKYHSSLYYHCLAHIPLQGDSANLYNKYYLEYINNVKNKSKPCNTLLNDSIDNLKKLYKNTAFAVNLNFIPLMFNDFSELDKCLSLLNNLNMSVSNTIVNDFNKQNEAFWFYKNLKNLQDSDLINLLYKVIKDEDQYFYSGYYKKKMELAKIVNRKCLNYLDLVLKPLLQTLFKNNDLKIKVYSVECMNKRARILPVNKTKVVIATRIPEKSTNYNNALFMILHELTHLITDNMLKNNYDLTKRDTDSNKQGYNLHWLMENSVLAFDYYILKNNQPILDDEYIKWCVPYVIKNIEPEIYKNDLNNMFNSLNLRFKNDVLNNFINLIKKDKMKAVKYCFKKMLFVPENVKALFSIH